MRAPTTTERYWSNTRPQCVVGGSASPVWQSDRTCIAPSTCARQGRTAASLRWCQRPTIVLKRRMTAHQYSSTWFERLRKEIRGVGYGLVSDNSVPALRVGQHMDQSSSRGLEKFGEDVFTIPEVIRAQTLNFKPNFKFSRSNVFWGTPIPILVCAIKAWSISSAY